MGSTTYTKLIYRNHKTEKEKRKKKWIQNGKEVTNDQQSIFKLRLHNNQFDAYGYKNIRYQTSSIYMGSTTYTNLIMGIIKPKRKKKNWKDFSSTKHRRICRSVFFLCNVICLLTVLFLYLFIFLLNNKKKANSIVKRWKIGSSFHGDGQKPRTDM